MSYGSEIRQVRLKDRVEKPYCAFCGSHNLAEIDRGFGCRTFMCRDCSQGYTIASDPNPFPWGSFLVTVIMLLCVYYFLSR